MIEKADVFVAVAVRPAGIMEEEGLAALLQGKRVFVLKPPALGAPGALTRPAPDVQGNFNLLKSGGWELNLSGMDVPAASSNPRRAPRRKISHSFLALRGAHWVKVKSDADLDSYLWHFTRSCPGPWPAESEEEYFLRLAAGLEGASHSGLDTLVRILSENTIRAASKIIRGRHAVVSLTAEKPGILLSKRRFQSHLARWDFEPYAIGIHPEEAARMGIKAVSYMPAEAYDKLSAAERPFFQKAGGGKTDWKHEKEWRCVGDVDLSELDPKHIRILVPADVAETFQARFRRGREPRTSISAPS